MHAPKKEQKHEPVRVCVKCQEQGVCQLWLIILIFISHNNKRLPQGELIYPLRNTLHTLFLINLLHLLCFNSFVRDYSASHLSFFSNALLFTSVARLCKTQRLPTHLKTTILNWINLKYNSLIFPKCLKTHSVRLKIVVLQ